MAGLRRVSLIGLLTVIVSGLWTVQANAAEFAEGYTEGGTAYGVRGNLVIRRPGLSGPDIYDLKVGGRLSSGAGNSYVGFRANSAGSVVCFYQVTGSRGT